MGDYASAREHQKRSASDLREEALGRRHEDTLWAMSGLAVTLHDQGDRDGARTLEQEVLEVPGARSWATVTPTPAFGDELPGSYFAGPRGVRGSAQTLPGGGESQPLVRSSGTAIGTLFGRRTTSHKPYSRSVS